MTGHVLGEVLKSPTLRGSYGVAAMSQDNDTVAASSKRQVLSAVLLALLAGLALHYGFRPWLADFLKAHAFTPQDAEFPLNSLNVALISVFAALLLPLTYFYARPYFICWYFALISWLFLYGLRTAVYLLKLQYPTTTLLKFLSDTCNNLNSFFFLLAAVALVDFERRKLLLTRLVSALALRHLHPFPEVRAEPSPGAPFHWNEILSFPFYWLGQYVWKCWPAVTFLLLLIAVLPAALALHPETYGHLYLIPEVTFSIFAIGLFGWALYARFHQNLPYAAFAILLIHLLYAQPQLAKLWTGPTGSPLEGGFVAELLLPSLIMKAAMGTFITLIVLADTEERRRNLEVTRLRGKFEEDLARRIGSVTHDVVKSELMRLGNAITKEENPKALRRLISELQAKFARFDLGIKDFLSQRVLTKPVLASCLPSAISGADSNVHPSEIRLLTVDEYQLRSVLENLCNNAKDHGGGVQSASVWQGDGKVRIRVKDFGTGPQPLKRETIQFLEDSLETSDNAATGLGLLLVKSIVYGNGGRIQAGVEDRSAWIEVCLPAELVDHGLVRTATQAEG